MLLLSPNQLFDISYIKNLDTSITDIIYFIEHPIFYGERNIKMNFNKKKILLHKASSAYYCDYLLKHKFNLKVITISQYKKSKMSMFKNSQIFVFDVCDAELMAELQKFNVVTLESPMFLSSREQLNVYWRAKKNVNQNHATFFKYQVAIHKIPYVNKSYDSENRNPMPDIPVPKMPNISTTSRKYINRYSSWCDKNYKLGNIRNFNIPITHADSRAWLIHFLENRMMYFGEYQDAIIAPKTHIPSALFHSVLSPMMNIGLITPKYIIDTVIQFYENKDADIRNVEAFIRQIAGWREYQRYLYIYFGDRIRTSNYFNNITKLSEMWYSGSTGIKAVDDAIKCAWDTGYLHHIQRLMIMCNFMNLCGISPHEVYKWFMEFSIDSYDWVMVGNVYSMGMWADGGFTMRKPYISTDNYIVHMSNGRYAPDEIWRSLFYRFIRIHKDKIKKTPYAKFIKHNIDVEKFADRFLKTL